MIARYFGFGKYSFYRILLSVWVIELIIGLSYLLLLFENNDKIIVFNLILVVLIIFFRTYILLLFIINYIYNYITYM